MNRDRESQEELSNHGKILRAAQERIARSEPLTLREVAKDAGVSLGTLNHYFINKQGLILAIQEDFQSEFNQLVADLAMKVAGKPLSEELVEDIVRWLYRWAHRNRWHFRMRIAEKIRNGKHLDPVMTDLSRLNSFAGKAAEKITGRSEHELRAFLLVMANSVARTVAIDTNEEHAQHLGRTAEEARKDVEDIHVELTLRFVFG